MKMCWPRMTQSMTHRGQIQTIYCCGQVGLGSRRLSIINLAGGQQPISNEDQSLWITFNGDLQLPRVAKITS